MVYFKESLLYFTEFLASLSYTVLASFYPGIANDKGVPVWLIGLIFSIDPVIGMPTSVVIGNYMNKIGRKHVLAIGILFGSVSMILIGFLEYSDRSNIVILSVFSRVFGGLGAGFSMTAGPAILISEYPEEKDKVISYLEAANGLGLVVGPLIGAGLSLYGLLIPFSVVATIYIINAILIYIFLSPTDPGPDTISITSQYPLLLLTHLLIKPVKL